MIHILHALAVLLMCMTPVGLGYLIGAWIEHREARK